MSDFLWPYGLQHTRLLCPSLSPRICSDSLSQWCYPTISSSVVPFSYCLQSFPASGSFPKSQLFTSAGQSIRALASIIPVNIQGWFLLGLASLISLQSKGLSRVFSVSLLYGSGLTCVHDYLVLSWNIIALTIWTFAGKVSAFKYTL